MGSSCVGCRGEVGGGEPLLSALSLASLVTPRRGTPCLICLQTGPGRNQGRTDLCPIPATAGEEPLPALPAHPQPACWRRERWGRERGWRPKHGGSWLPLGGLSPAVSWGRRSSRRGSVCQHQRPCAHPGLSAPGAGTRGVGACSTRPVLESGPPRWGRRDAMAPGSSSLPWTLTTCPELLQGGKVGLRWASWKRQP